MFQRLWQSGMIALARSAKLKSVMQSARATSTLATRYVIGPDATGAVAGAARLREDDGIRASLFYLGEYVETRDGVSENVTAKQAVIQALAATSLELHVSVDPTQIGQVVDPELMRDNARTLARAIAEATGDRPGLNAMMIDMEDDTLVGSTVALHDDLRAEGLPCALTLQAYLRRTEADLDAQIAAGSTVRLVKGAFVAAADIAFTGQSAIKANYRRLIDRMFSKKARNAGFHPVVASHDDRIQDHAIAAAKENGWPDGAWEIEMLLGVRGDLARRRAAEGHRVRLYTPFGRDWWPYAVRRIGESPRNALFVARSLLAGG